MKESVWTPDRVEALTALVAEGLSYNQIGERLGVTKNQAISKSSRLGLRRENAPKPTRAAFPPHGFCVWPEGDPGEEGFRFCTSPVALTGVPYCEPHMRRGYVRVVG